MRQNRLLSLEAEPWDEQIDRDDFLEVAALDDPTGDNEMSGRLEFAFRLAGYVVRKVEKAPYHPVWIIYLAGRRSNIPFDDGTFRRDVQRLLQTADISVRTKDIMVNRKGRTLLVTFVVLPPPRKRRNKAGLRQLLAELP